MLYGTVNGSSGINGSTNNIAMGLIPPNPDSSIVVKVSSPAKGDVMYKSVIIGNSDHTPKVVALALEKLGLEEEDPANFNLVQVLPHKELTFPSNANIFYAVDTSAAATSGDIRLEVRPNRRLFNAHHQATNNNNNNNNNNSLRGVHGKRLSQQTESHHQQQPRST